MVVDEANVLSSDAKVRINRQIFAVKAASGGELVVVTMPDIAGRDVGDIALRIGREWKVGANAAIGDRARNAAVVVLLIPKETSSDGQGHISIQTGQGAEGFITDATAGEIRREAVPYLRARDYSSAMELITQRLSQRFAAEFGFNLDSTVVDPRFEVNPTGLAGGFPPQLLFVLFILFLFVMIALANANRRRGRGGVSRRGNDVYISWGGGGFGGGSWGGGDSGGFGGFGGGGGFSGGGSSGSW